MFQAENNKELSEDQVYLNWIKWSSRFSHIFLSPNTRYHDRKLFKYIKTIIKGKSVLDIGCGSGRDSVRLHHLGAKRVLGIDYLQNLIDQASVNSASGGLEFLCQSIDDEIKGKFDIIFGRAVLHHLDYKSILNRLISENLNPGGTVIFLEPLGDNPIIRLWHCFSSSSHVDDERPFLADDIKWLRNHFVNLRFIPYNFLTLPFGAVSSLVSNDPHNVVMRLCHSIDLLLAKNFPKLETYFRYGIMIIRE